MIGFGRYNLLVSIGTGGMGTVWLARQKVLRRFCALKLMDPALAQKPDAASRFLREARTAASLAHPNLVGVFDGDVQDGHHFIAMEYVPGYGLSEVIARLGAVPLALALLWLDQAAAALEYIHSRHLIHRDVKPQNMLIDPDGSLKLMDLGLAKDTFQTDNSLTLAGEVLGSPSYMSPEQIQDSRTVDARSDLYALGISFYQMLTGRLPFDHTSAAAVCAAQLNEPVPSVEFTDPELTRELDEFIAMLTAKKPDDRWQSAAQVRGLLRSWLERFPWDSDAALYFSQIQFHDRAVDHLLSVEGIDPAQVDDKVARATDADLTGQSSGAVDAPTVIDASVRTPTLPPVIPRRKPWLWLIGGVLLGAALVAGTAVATLKVAIPKIVAATKSLTKPTTLQPKPTGTLADLQARQQQRRQLADRTLDEARLISAADWPTRKTAILDKFRTSMEHTGKPHDPQLLNRTLANISQLLEEARALDAAAYRQAKPKLIERWLMWGRKNPEKPNRPVIESPPTSAPPLAEP